MNDEVESGPDRGGLPPGFLPLLCLTALTLSLYGLFMRPEPERIMGTWLSLPMTLAIYTGAFGLGLWLSMPGARNPPEPASEGPICLHCMDPFMEGVHFCPRCAAPLTAFAATGGYEHIYAQAWCLGRAAHGPTRPIHAVGLGLLAAPFLAYCAFLLWNAVGAHLGPQRILQVGAHVGVAWIYIVLFLRCLTSYSETAWAALPREERPLYGHPPYWTYDRWWILPLTDPDDGDPLEPEGGDEATPPPLPT